MPGFDWLLTADGNAICREFPLLCSDIVTTLFGGDPVLDNYDRYDVIAEHEPGQLWIMMIAGTSVKNILTYSKHMNGDFRRYDYGEAEN